MAPSITDCRAKIYAGGSPEVLVVERECSAEGIDDPLPVWLRTSPTRIQVSYNVAFSAPVSAPPVSYVRSSQLGITLATFALRFSDNSIRESKFSVVIICFDTAGWVNIVYYRVVYY